MSRGELAAKAGLASAYIREVENGRLRPTCTARRRARRLVDRCAHCSSSRWGRMLPTTPVAITTLGDDGADSAGPAVTEETDKRLRRKGPRASASWAPRHERVVLL